MAGTTAPPGIIAAAEQDYHMVRDRVSVAVGAARLLLAGRGAEVEAFADVYYMLRRVDPRLAGAVAAAAILGLCRPRELAELIFFRSLRLPRRHPGATRPELLGLRRSGTGWFG